MLFGAGAHGAAVDQIGDRRRDRFGDPEGVPHAVRTPQTLSTHASGMITTV